MKIYLTYWEKIKNKTMNQKILLFKNKIYYYKG